MAKKEKKSVLREIRSLVLVLGSAAVMAGGLCLFLAWSQGSGSGYVVKNILLAPDLLVGKATLQDFDYHHKLQRAWVFDSVEVMMRDGAHGVVRKPVSAQAYEKFYARLAKERSINEPEDKLARRFASPLVTTVLLTLKPTGAYAAALSSKEFQEIQIAPGGTIRVQLHEQGDGWAYFRIAGFDQEAKRLLLGYSG